MQLPLHRYMIGILSIPAAYFGTPMFQAIKERRFAKRLIRQLLQSYRSVTDSDRSLYGNALYRKVLLHSEKVNETEVDEILKLAETSVDDWTAGAADSYDFRQVVHFVVMSKYEQAGHIGAVISFKDVVYSLVPESL